MLRNLHCIIWPLTQPMMCVMLCNVGVMLYVRYRIMEVVSALDILTDCTVFLAGCMYAAWAYSRAWELSQSSKELQ